MNVWFLIFEDGDDASNNTTSVYETEFAAYKQAVNEVIDEIQSNWDLTDQDSIDVAYKINDLAQVGDYNQAIKEYHDSLNNYGSNLGGRVLLWSIVEDPVRTEGSIPMPNTIIFTDIDEDEDEDEDPILIENIKVEESCQSCGRTNDVGVSVCWNCGNHP